MPTKKTLAPQCKKLLRDLCGRDTEARNDAVKEALALSYDDRLALIEALINAQDEGVLFLAFGWVLLLVAGVFMTIHLAHHRSDHLGQFFGMFVLTLLFSFMMIPRSQQRWRRRVVASLTALLTGAQEPRLLAAMLSVNPWSQSASAKYNETASPTLPKEAIKILLPFLQPGDAEQWTPGQKRNFLHYLRSPYADAELTVRLIEASQKIDDPEVQKVVARLSVLPKAMAVMARPIEQSRKEYWENIQRIQQAAQACQPEDILLRGASAPVAAQSEILLRAAASHDETPPEQLLRPTE